MSNSSNKNTKFIPMYDVYFLFTHLIEGGMLWKHLSLFLVESRILARIMQPTADLDYVLILKGHQTL